jgi:integrase
MASAKLTKTFVSNVHANGKQQEFWDTELPGFMLRVSADGGTRSYWVKYRVAGQQRKHKVGTHPAVTAEEARKLAVKALGEVHSGGDPADDRRKRRAAWTMNDLVAHWREVHKPVLRPSTAKSNERFVRDFIVPRLGSRKVADVTHADVAAFHHKLSSHPTQANRVIALLSKMFSLASRAGVRPDNPVSGTTRNPERTRERYLSDDEVGRLLVACDRHPNQQVANLVRLMLFTSARKGEALRAQWSQIDLDRGTWLKPASTTKQKKTHVAVLNEPAVDMLRDMAKTADKDCDWVFPGRAPKDPSEPRKPLHEPKRPIRQIFEAAEIGNASSHTLRHTALTIAAAETGDLQAVRGLGGHASTE